MIEESYNFSNNTYRLKKGKLKQFTYVTKYSTMDQVKFFKGCLPQILLGPFLNTLTDI